MSTRSAVDRMAAQRFPTDADLERIAPHTDRERRLDALLAQPRPTEAGRDPALPVPSRRSPVLLAFAVVAIVVIGIVGGLRALPQRPTPAAPPGCGTTQAPDAPTLLRALADCAQAQPALPDGRFDYLHTLWWGPGLYEGGSGEELGTVETWTWTAPDGSGRKESKTPRATSSTDLGPTGRGRTDWPTDVAALDAAIRDSRGHRTPLPAPETEWISAVAQIASNTVVSPQLQAALLRLLATKPGVTVDGPVTDHAGRAGVAVSVGGEYAGLPARHVLVLDPATGRILGTEEIVLASGNGVLLAAPPPAPAHYTLILGSTRVNTTTDKPQ
ncbi:CU044_5270 family protein [Pseudonocardia sp. CA-107938]|uniref:CU044_5270 family protein n=1 Tax=Pseudonocardia sp. CA-107938 TaxID=3240021 RepID=UPI003D9068FE